MATQQQLEQALTAADAAGDADGARQIAGSLNQFLATQQQQLGVQQEQLKQQQVTAGNVDKESGAPFDVRTAVGAARTQEDKLLTLQKLIMLQSMIRDLICNCIWRSQVLMVRILIYLRLILHLTQHLKDL